MRICRLFHGHKYLDDDWLDIMEHVAGSLATIVIDNDGRMSNSSFLGDKG
jgi:hypothetical protein